MSHKSRNYRKTAIAKAEYVKALYKKDKACGTLMPMSKYIDLFSSHTKTEFIVQYLTTDKSAEWYLDQIREHSNRQNQEKIKADNIKKFKQAVSKIDPKQIEELSVTASNVPEVGDGTIDFGYMAHKEVFIKIIYKPVEVDKNIK